MPFIHERPQWPDFTWDNAKLAGPCSDARLRQGKLLGRMEALGLSFRDEANLRVLTADVVKSSAIEGEVLDPGAVRSSIARRLGMDAGGVPPTSRDVEGVVEMMLNATQKSQEPLTSERLFGWHAALFPLGRSGMRRITVGDWRKPASDPMEVVSGAMGKEKVHFVAPEGARVPNEMEAFLAWFAKSDTVDPILRAGIAHLWFVTIHPFEDGNGRIARAIADLALARSEGGAPRYYSMSAQIESERKDYYLELERSQRGDTDITPWLEWFVGCCRRALTRAEQELSGVLSRAKIWDRINAGTINERQRAVINRLLEGFQGKLSSSKYAKLAKCSQPTAVRDINLLVEQGILEKDEAGGRSTSYNLVGGLPSAETAS